GDAQRGAGGARAPRDPPEGRARRERPGPLMAPRVLLRLGLRSLLLHKLRSFLSILGVVFGVAGVTAMSSVGEGARRESLAQIGALGVDTVTLRARAPAAGASPRPGLRPPGAEAVGGVVAGARAGAHAARA